MSSDQLLDSLPLEVWRGSARAWQCDEMGHLNSSFYIAIADEGFIALAAQIGIGAEERATHWRPAHHHMRFMREIMGGTSLHMRAGVTAIHEDGISILQILVNSETAETCAIIATRFRCRGSDELVLDSTIRAKAVKYLVPIPTDTYSQAIPDRLPEPSPTFALAKEVGLRQTALGCFLPEEGRHRSDDVATHAVIGRISDATRFLSRLFERTARSLDREQPRLGTAALECRLDYLRWPKVGERFSIQSGYSEIGSRSSRRIVHWIFEADSGEPLSTVHTLEVNFDLDQRRARPVDPAVPSILKDYLVERLRP